MTLRYYLIPLIAAASSCLSYADSPAATQTDSIAAALRYQREHYPVSQYRDVYKNFMQDFFGPGHILADTVAAGRYLRSELAETDIFDGPLFEPTGFRGNFYRVNISLIKDGIIPYDVFFDAFVNSVQSITPPDGEYWMDLWSKIDEEIIKMGWTFQNEQSDRSDLGRQFKEGNYIAHHSKAYNDAVNFHYRIISKANFERYIRPYLSSD